MASFEQIYWVFRANGSRWKTFHMLTTCSGIIRGDQVPYRQSLTFELETAVNEFILLYGLIFDEATFRRFRRKIAYPLVASNLEGVYTSPAPPGGFNANTASAADLVKNGLLWGRRGPNDNPALIEAWNKVFSRQWPATDRVTPTFEQQPGKTHQLRKPLVKQKDGNYVGGVWSGAGIIGGPWTGLIGFWNIPTVSKAPQAGTPGWDSSSWIGIDGFNISNDVRQVGIQQSVSSNPARRGSATPGMFTGCSHCLRCF
jgi:hypothetical protein